METVAKINETTAMAIALDEPIDCEALVPRRISRDEAANILRAARKVIDAQPNDRTGLGIIAHRSQGGGTTYDISRTELAEHYTLRSSSVASIATWPKTSTWRDGNEADLY